MDYIDSNADDQVSKDIVTRSRKSNVGLKDVKLSSREINDVSMQIFRSIAISKMVQSVTGTFVANIDRMMRGVPDPTFELIRESDCYRFCKAVKDFDRRYGFQHRDVLKLELQGHNYIHAVMNLLWDAIFEDGAVKSTPFAQYVYGSMSENYRRVYEASPRALSDQRHLVCDAISGMTESYLINYYLELRDLKDAG